MTVTTKLEGTRLTVSAEGKMGTTSAPEFEKAVRDNIDGITELVFDLEKLDYMASAGLRILLLFSGCGSAIIQYTMTGRKIYLC